MDRFFRFLSGGWCYPTFEQPVPGQTGIGNVGGGKVKIRVLVEKPLRARREPKNKLNRHNCGVDAGI